METEKIHRNKPVIESFFATLLKRHCCKNFQLNFGKFFRSFYTEHRRGTDSDRNFPKISTTSNQSKKWYTLTKTNASHAQKITIIIENEKVPNTATATIKNINLRPKFVFKRLLIRAFILV